MSVISPDSVLLPKKNSKWDYEEGDLIEAVYNRGKSYQAVISEVHRKLASTHKRCSVVIRWERGSVATDADF